MLETSTVTRVWRPPAVRTWEIRTSSSGPTLWVHRTDGGKIEIHHNGQDFEIPDNFVEIFGEVIAQAVVWEDTGPDAAPAAV